MTSSFEEKIAKVKTALENVFVKKSSTSGLLKNDGTVDTNTYLTQHQSLSNYIQKSQTSGLVKNDGTIDTTSYSTFTGSYNDLTNKPTIPTDVNDLSDNNGIIPSDVSDLSDLLNTTFTPKSHNHGRISSDGYILDGNGDVITGNNMQFLYGATSSGEIRSSYLVPAYLKISNAYDNIKSGESTTITMDNQEKLNDGINTKFGTIDTALNGKANSTHNHSSSNVTDMTTVNVLVTYTDNTTETLTLFKQTNNN